MTTSMTPAELDQVLDDMQAKAAGNPNLMPGVITVQTNDWIERTADIRATCKAIHDGLRHRDIRIEIGAGQTTVVLTRADAGERGAPYRDMLPKQ